MDMNYWQSLFCSLRRVISDQLDVKEEEIQPDSTWERLGADSLDRLEMTRAIEEAFVVEIPHTVGETLNTVGQTLEHLMALLAPAIIPPESSGQMCWAPAKRAPTKTR